MKKKKLIAIVGPTASGKTGLGVFLAKKYDGEIVSADSRQVFRGLDIGTGKEGEQTSNTKHQTSRIEVKNQELGEKVKNLRWIDGVPQWMIDVCGPEERFTLFDYLDQARGIIEDVFSRGKLPIIVGGTGLYVSALIEGFELKKNQDVIARSSATKQSSKKIAATSGLLPAGRHGAMTRYSRTELERMPLEELQKIIFGLKADSLRLQTSGPGLKTGGLELKTEDLRLDKNNPRRLIRAIERAQGGDEMTKIKPDFESLVLAIDIPREQLYKRIDKRANDRFKAGMLEETKSLLKKGIDPEWLISLGLDYRVMTQYLLSQKEEYRIQNKEFSEDGTQEYKKMIERFQYAEHDYARRQLTWWRNKPAVAWISNQQEALDKTSEFLSH